MIDGKKGGVAMTILFAAFFFLIGILVVNFLRQDVTDFNTNMNCDDANSLSDGLKITCLLGNGVIIYWIIAICSIAGGLIIDKFAP